MVPDGPDVVVRAPGRVGRAPGTCPDLPGPIRGLLKNRLLEGVERALAPRQMCHCGGWCPMDRLGSYGHQEGPGVPLAPS